MTKSARSTWGVFVRGLLRSPRAVGAVAPASRYLVQAMLDAARLNRAQVIAEFGPGTGVFTHGIIPQMRPDARLFVFEINPTFAAHLRAIIADPRVTIVEASAADSAQILAKHDALPVDAVISGLPFTSLPRSVTHAILQTTTEILRPDGVFVTYQYTTVLRSVLQHYFPSMRITRLVLRNVPPAFVFAGAPGHQR